MTVKTLLTAANACEFISVEDENYNVFADGDAAKLSKMAILDGMDVACFYTGWREGYNCTVVIVKNRRVSK